MSAVTVRTGVGDNGDEPPTTFRYVETVTGRGGDRVEVRIEEYGADPQVVFLSLTMPDAGATLSQWADFAAPVRVPQIDRVIAQLIAARDRARAVGILPSALCLTPPR